MRRAWWALLPLVVGAGLAAAFQLGSPDTRVFVAVSPALLVLLLGVLGTATWLGSGFAVAVVRAGRLRSAEVAAATAEASRRRFARRLDHELKNPLTALIAALGGPDDLPDAVRHRVARAQADRLRRLLVDLRRVADVEVVPLDAVRVDIAQLLHEVVNHAVDDAGDRRRVRVDVPSAPRPLPPVHGDPDLLAVAVHNVVGNALKYTRPGDAIEVRAREITSPRPAVLLEIADAGHGIAVDEHQLVWEELARGRSAGAVPGSGVGLALVRVIVERHGGSVALDSRPGGGTVVSLVLPSTGVVRPVHGAAPDR